MEISCSLIACIAITALLILEDIVRKSEAASSIPNMGCFRFSIWTVIAVICGETAALFFEHGPTAYRTLHLLTHIWEIALSPYIPLLIGYAIGSRYRKNLMLFGIPAVINLLMALLSIRYPLIFVITDQNEYLRGAAFWVYALAYVSAMIYLLLQTVQITRDYQNNNRPILLMLFGFMVSGMLIQIVAPHLHISWLCVAFSMILYYMYYCDLFHQIDSLTGLLNRSTYESYLIRMQDCDRVCVIVFDADDFKSINDKYGHLFGDYCLATVATCIRKSFFKIGLCFRIGGDEFCVVAENTSRTALHKAYGRFLYEIEASRQKENRLPMVSIGYSFAHGPGQNIFDVISQADQNMYQFKRQRKENRRV